MKRNPDIIAIIPARGGSKRIPGKNLLPLAGRPVLVYSILHAKSARHVREVIVSTDDKAIADVARAHGATVVTRPAGISDDKATSESALLHVLDERRRRGLKDPDLVVFLQCTSPVRRAGDIDDAIDALLAKKADSLFSACENKRLIWGVNRRGPFSINYDHKTRRREQDMAVQYRENGSIYVFKPSILRRHSNRLGGRMAVFEMDYWSSFQIDDPEHVELIEWILRKPDYAPAVSWPSRIDLVVFDFDGVMTDNRVHVDQRGKESVSCSRADGLGIASLLKSGVRSMVLSTEENPVVAARCRKLRLQCHQGLKDKADYLGKLLRKEDIDARRVVFVGNDSNDLGCLRMVGFPVVTADAHASVRSSAAWVLSRPGGRGAVREVCDAVVARYQGGRS